MPVSTMLGIALTAVAAAAVALRIIAARRPELRGVATIATFGIFAILVALIGLAATSIFRGLAGGIGV
jgi:hypothetical protein